VWIMCATRPAWLAGAPSCGISVLGRKGGGRSDERPCDSKCTIAGPATQEGDSGVAQVQTRPQLSSSQVVFSVDQSKSMRDQAVPGHNRWHPDVPAVAKVKPGQDFRVECREWTDAQLKNSDSAN